MPKATRMLDVKNDGTMMAAVTEWHVNRWIVLVHSCLFSCLFCLFVVCLVVWLAMCLLLVPLADGRPCIVGSWTEG